MARRHSLHAETAQLTDDPLGLPRPDPAEMGAAIIRVP